MIPTANLSSDDGFLWFKRFRFIIFRGGYVVTSVTSGPESITLIIYLYNYGLDINNNIFL